MCWECCSLPAACCHTGFAPYIRKAVSSPSSLQEPGGEGRAALQSLDRQPEATETHQEAEEKGKGKQARATAGHGLASN